MAAVVRATQSLSARCRSFLVRSVGAVVVGVVGGVLSALFLGSLNWAGTTRLDSAWLVWLLPIGGLFVGLLYHRFGRPVAGGTSLVLDSLHVADHTVPTRMAPMIWGGSVLSHLVGASVGREGAAVQIVAGVSDDAARRVGIRRTDRNVLVVCAIAAAFGGLFGVPVAGGVFALEVQRESRRHLNALPHAVGASVVAHLVATAVGVGHGRPFRVDDLGLGWDDLWRYAVAAVFFGVVAASFVFVEHAVKRLFTRLLPWPPLRPMVGGIGVLALVGLAGTRAYLGVSFDLVDVALTGAAGIAAAAFVWKIAFTTISLGSGFVGGEMLPLFVIGALTGAQFARVTDASVPLFAALGLVAVFAAASKTPLACIVIGIELFGWAGVPAYVIVCAIAVLSSGRATIYPPSPIADRTVAGR